ncbi:MAG: CPBP family intramembrane metalloprotease [Eubacterium sp.]|nr:CPBP family intramembrane metalloprotease [Eubacterium sp.]
MDKKKVIKFVAIVYGIVWTLQIIGAILQDRMAGMKGIIAFRGSLVISMFIPMIVAFFLKADFKGMGWKPRLRGNIKWLILSLLLPSVCAILGWILFFIVFPDLFAMDGSYLIKVYVSVGMNAEEAMSKMNESGMDMKTLFLLSVVMCIVEVPFINMLTGIGEEVGWRGFLYPELMKNMSRVKAWLLGGIIWAAFHFPAMIFGGYEYGKNYIGAPVLGLVSFSIACIAVGIMHEIIYDKTKCIWYPALFHGAINGVTTLYVMLLDGNQIEKIDKLFVFGPFSFGLISVIPFVVAAIIMGALALKKDNER